MSQSQVHGVPHTHHYCNCCSNTRNCTLDTRPSTKVSMSVGGSVKFCNWACTFLSEHQNGPRTARELAPEAEQQGWPQLPRHWPPWRHGFDPKVRHQHEAPGIQGEGHPDGLGQVQLNNANSDRLASFLYYEHAGPNTVSVAATFKLNGCR